MKMISVLLIAVLIQGCAVGMALSGKPDPNIGLLSTGQDRGIVILSLGEPSSVLVTPTGRTDVFRLEKGNEPSVGRASFHALMDLLTWGLWEFIGTPMEAFAGEKINITVNYDNEDKVTRVISN